jgi:hypothetical protein
VPKLPAKGLILLIPLAAVLAAACASPAPATARPPTVFVIPTDLPNGRVEITISPTYALGAVATIPVAISVTRGSVTGPLTARIMASGISEGGGVPAEVLVRELSVKPSTVGAARTASTTVIWDTRDANGAIVPADAYTLLLEVRSDDGGSSHTVTASATLDVR